MNQLQQENFNFPKNNFLKGRNINHNNNRYFDNNFINNEFPDENNMIDFSLKGLKSEVEQMSENLKVLNEETDKIILNKNYSLKNFRSYSKNNKSKMIDYNNNLKYNPYSNKYVYNNNNLNYYIPNQINDINIGNPNQKRNVNNSIDNDYHNHLKLKKMRNVPNNINNNYFYHKSISVKDDNNNYYNNNIDLENNDNNSTISYKEKNKYKKGYIINNKNFNNQKINELYKIIIE